MTHPFPGIVALGKRYLHWHLLLKKQQASSMLLCRNRATSQQVLNRHDVLDITKVIVLSSVLLVAPSYAAMFQLLVHIAVSYL